MNGASEDIKIKCRLLATDPSLIKLHRDLVASGAITEEEFWSTRQELLKTQAALLAQKTPPSIALEGAASKTLPIEAKVVDKSITYTVTPGIIREIFARTPAVAKAHQELVAAEGRGKAARMSERDFWLAYFKSAFFDPGALRDPKNPLHAYLAVDEQPLAKEAPMEDELDEEPPEDLSADDESLQVESKPVATRSDATLELIKKLNRMSTALVKKSANKAPSRRFNIAIEDLEEPTEEFSPIPLNIQLRKDRADGHDVEMGDATKIRELLDAGPREAGSRLYTYEQFSRLVKGQLPTVKAEVKPDLNCPFASVDDLRFFNLKCVEVLRLFWRQCYPLTTPESVSRAAKIVNLIGDLRRQIHEWIEHPAGGEKIRRAYAHTLNALEHASRLYEEAHLKPSKRAKK